MGLKKHKYFDAIKKNPKKPTVLRLCVVFIPKRTP